jgi:stearoyl-CoA desaturase (delta-9 desaturase)
MYVKVLESLGLATVRKQAPKVKLDPSKWEVDAVTLQAVIMHRFDVMANYAKSIKRTSKLEIEALRAKGHDCAAMVAMRKWLHRDRAVIPAAIHPNLDRVVEQSVALKTSLTMRQELARLWERSTLNTEQLVSQLKDWCERAEKSGVEPLVEFSHRLRSYA